MSARSRPYSGSARLPADFTPQLALLVKSAPDGDEWVHEIKYDGFRIGARLEHGKVKLISRNGQDWTGHFPSVAHAVAELPAEQALLDGEVAAVLPDGRTSFQALQNAGARGAQIIYFVFDIIHLDGADVAALPLEQRKERLAGLLKKLPRNSPVRYAAHVAVGGSQFFAEASRLGLEGIISKRRDLPYKPGRGPSWVKTKRVKRQEMVIGGFTEPEGSRTGIGAVLVGVYDKKGALLFAGKVGTGFSQKSAQELRRQLNALEQDSSPFADVVPAPVRKRAHWVRPTLIAEVAFTEWTNDGRVRHPSFQGLRSDKPASSIVREEAAELATIEPRAASTSPSPPRNQMAQRKRSKKIGKRADDRVEIAGVSFSHPDRIVYPELGLTKLDLAHYYEAIAEWILPHLKGRPLTLVRCPANVASGCFYMKHAGGWTPKGVRIERIQEKKKIGEYLVVDTLQALLALVQANVIEIHTWNATVDRIEIPDRLVFDLDPGPDVAWKTVVESANLVRTVLSGLELECFVKTTGGKGLHVVLPLAPEAEWRVGLQFALDVAAKLVELQPDLYTTEFSKAGRANKILVDVMRNNRLNTSVAAYSTRARASGGVSTPISWRELTRLRSADHHTVRNVLDLVRKRATDPWAGYWSATQRLPPDAPQRLAALR